MVHVAIIRRGTRMICAPLAASMFLTVLCTAKARNVLAVSQTQSHRRPPCSDALVIQGRITTIQGALVTVKTPDGYPGGSGVHAHFVIAGPSFKVEVSRARVLLADGKQADKRPLAVGDRVLIVLHEPGSGSPAPRRPGNISQTYFASIIERIADSDKIITH